MSLLSKAIGKIPVVGHALNQVGKILPSAGQLIGGAALGPLGNVVGGAIDGNTTPLQKTIGNTVAGTAAGLGLGSLAGAVPSLGGALKAGANALGGGSGGFSLGSLVDPALGGLSLYNAAKLGDKSSDLADSALKTANESYDTRAPLRLSGVEGMLHPEAGNAAKLAGVNATIGRGNPFAAKPQPIPLSGVR